jgi:nucleotide-binding universal stress UspA family protein
MTSRTSNQGSRIAVGYDGSGASRSAVLWAAREAAARGGSLRIVTVWESGPITPWSLPDLPKWRARARQAAEQAASAAREIAGAAVIATSRAIEGSAGRVLVEESASCDLIVVGSAGYLGTSGWLTGSVSRHLSRRSACPVVVLGPRAHVDLAQRLVVSSNLDPDGETDAWITAWLSSRTAEVHVVGSVRLTATVPDWLTHDIESKLRAASQAANVEFVRRLRRRLSADVNITEEVVPGTASDALRQVSRPGDLIVVPAGAEHAIALTDSSCPLVVVPSASAMRSEREIHELTDVGTP